MQEGRHAHVHNPAESPSTQGEEDIGGSAPDPTVDDDVERMVEEVTGRKPKLGQTFSDLISQETESNEENTKDKKTKIR